jgi:CRP/FNR family transcriptional regulator, cyclic AMP receptor protein
MIESKYLRDNLKNVEQLTNIPVFKTVGAKKLASLLKLSKIRQYESGECIIRKGEEDSWLYFLLSGSVRVRDRGYPVATIAKAGEIFGEMRLTDGGKRSASVFAENKTICLAVDLDAKDRLNSEREEALLLDLLFAIISRNLSLRLRSVNDEFVRIKDELAEQGPFSPYKMGNNMPADGMKLVVG